MQVADVVVVGLGAMGSASAYQLAKRGLDIVALDRFTPPHAEGSSHGESRVTRQAIGEGETYVPFVLRSHEIWREIESETGESLLLACGALVIGRTESAPVHHGKPDFLKQTVAAARRYGIAHEVLDARAMTSRYPQVALDGDEEGYFEPGGGLLYPERCVAAQMELARRHGARLSCEETVLAVEPDGERVRVTTDRDSYAAAHAVVAAGAWTPALVGAPLAALEIHRQALFWFEPESPRLFAPERFPVFIWMHGSTDAGYFYGFPVVPGGSGVKVATETYHAPAGRPELIDRSMTAEDAGALFDAHVEGRLKGLKADCLRSATCLYTTTPDGDFVIDAHPASDRILLVSACSGHGFKHSAAIGEAVAERIAAGRSRLDLSRFSLGRFDRSHVARA